MKYEGGQGGRGGGWEVIVFYKLNPSDCGTDPNVNLSKNIKQTAVIIITRQRMLQKLSFMNLTFRMLQHTSSEVTVTLKKSEALEAARPIGDGAYPGFHSMKRLEVFLLPLDGMLVHRRSLPRKLSGFPQQFAGTHLYTWVERGTVRVKCLA